MVDRNQDSEKESSATSDAGAEPTGTGDLPGEFLAEDLAEAPEYEVAADETEAEELSDPDDGSDEVSDEEQLEEATAVAAVAPSSRPKRREVAKKDAPTSRRRSATVKGHHRATPAQFVRESADELRKVIWPTGVQVRQYFSVVLIFVLVIIAFVGVLDLLFGMALLKLLG